MLMSPASTLSVVDKDVLEDKNLSRQLFSQSDIGKSKARAICERYAELGPVMEPIEEWLTEGVEWIKPDSIIIVCVDNHAARRSALYKADELGATVYNGANEYLSADAYLYKPEWKDSPNDPRVWAPSILTDETGNPIRPEGCTGHIQESSPQLVVANTTAASLVMRLFWWWEVEVKSREMESLPHWPVWHVATPQRVKTTLYGERK
jgi:hypothetical protein